MPLLTAILIIPILTRLLLCKHPAKWQNIFDLFELPLYNNYKLWHLQIMKHFLIAIIPSEDVVLKIMQLRTLIFRNFGLVSSRCLPEMIPVSFIPKSVSKEQFKGLTLPQAVCTSVCSATENGDLFLQIKDKNFALEIKNRIDSFETSGIINIQTGFYLVTANTDTVLKDVLAFVHSEIEENITD